MYRHQFKDCLFLDIYSSGPSDVLMVTMVYFQRHLQSFVVIRMVPGKEPGAIYRCQ